MVMKQKGERIFAGREDPGRWPPIEARAVEGIQNLEGAPRQISSLPGGGPGEKKFRGGGRPLMNALR